MLSHSEFAGLMVRNAATFFSVLPADLTADLLNPYYFYNTDPNCAIAKALQLSAFGNLDELKTILEQAKAKLDKTELKCLLLQKSDTVTRAGLQVKCKTILECALGEGDMELVEMIMPYFNEFAGGPEERKRQFDPYQSCIAAIPTQQPDYDVSWLIEIIKTSLHEDVLAELATGDNYDPSYQSPLRDAMNRFRSEMLDPKRRVITTARMHCNYQNLGAADAILDREWNGLQETEGDGYDKRRLVARQILGFIQLVELPAYERYVFAGGQSEQAIAGEKIARFLNYKYPSELGEAFPDYSEASINFHSGVGFDSFASIFGGRVVRGLGWCVRGGGRREAGFYKTYVEQKQQVGRNLCCNCSNAQTVSQQMRKSRAV